MACSSHESGNADRRLRQRRARSSPASRRAGCAASISRTCSRYSIEPHAVARAEPALERGDVAAAPSRGCCGSAACARTRSSVEPGRPNIRSKTTRGLVSIGIGVRRRLPRDRVHVGAAVADVAGADVAGEVLGGDLERREHACRSPICLAMIWSSEVPATKSSASVRFGAQPVSHVPVLTACVPCSGRSMFETTVDRVAERLERLEDRAELEAGAGGRRRPVARAARPSARRRRRSAWSARRRSSPSPSAPAPSRRAAAAPSVAPSPRRTVRRDSDCLRDEHRRAPYQHVPVEFSLAVPDRAFAGRRLHPHLERHAADDAKHNRREPVVVPLRHRGRSCARPACPSPSGRGRAHRSAASRSSSGRTSPARAAAPARSSTTPSTCVPSTS